MSITSYNYKWKQYKHHGKETIEGYTFTRIPPVQFNGRWNMKIIKLTKTIPWHTDWDTKCAINYLLNDDLESAGHIEMGEKAQKFQYRMAVIDTTKRHRAVVYDKPRKILKISIFDETYEEICKKLDSLFTS